MIDAACNAVAKAVGVDASLASFQVAAVTPGTDAVGDVSVQVDVAGQRVNARGVSTDVVEASARAFLHAINKVVTGTAVRPRTDKP
jgi:2-isopropylmalate synthase